MRRNITVSLDDEFIRGMDAARGSVARSRWLEGLVEGGALMPAIPSRELEAQMKAEDRSKPRGGAGRSPKAAVKNEEPREETPLPKIAKRHWA